MFAVVNSSWLLDDFSPLVGATRLVPRSHLRLGVRPSDDADDEAIQVVAKAGSVLVWNGSVWHACCENRSTHARRRAVHCAWIDRRYAQQTSQRERLRPQTAGRLSPLGRYLLDVAE
eukprot:SAG25_NODE_142_length_14075_cov_38.666070_5_plen_117_part_00